MNRTDPERMYQHLESIGSSFLHQRYVSHGWYVVAVAAPLYYCYSYYSRSIIDDPTLRVMP